MKTFITAVITFLVVTALVTASTIYIQCECAKADDLARLLPDIPANDDSEARFTERDHDFYTASESLRERWKKCRFLICLSVSHAEAQKLDDAISETVVRWGSRDASGYMSSRNQLISLITQLKKTEDLSFEGIL